VFDFLPQRQEGAKFQSVLYFFMSLRLSWFNTFKRFVSVEVPTQAEQVLKFLFCSWVH